MGAPFWASYILLWILVLIQCAAIFAMYHHFAQMYLSSREGRDKQGPALGSPFSDLTLTEVGGELRPVRPPGRATLVVLASTTCKICSTLRFDLAELAARHQDIDISVVCDGTVPQVEEWSHGLRHSVPVFPDQSHRIRARLDVGMTPYLIGIDHAGIVRAKGLVNDLDGLELAALEIIAPSNNEVDRGGISARGHG